MFDKKTVLDYLWNHSRFYCIRLHECEELYQQKRGHVAVNILFSCLESISKSVVNDYDSSSFCIYQKLYSQDIVSIVEYSFINTDEFSIRKIRNLFAHANISAIYLIVDQHGAEALWPLVEDDTALLLYELISDIVFNLILKIVCATLIEEVSSRLRVNLDDYIDTCKLKFKILTAQELLVLKGFPADYIPDSLGIPEDAKIRIIGNAPDVNIYTHILGQVASILEDNTNPQA